MLIQLIVHRSKSAEFADETVIYLSDNHVYREVLEFMTEPLPPEEECQTITLEALPDGSLNTTHVDALREGDTLDMVAPLVIDESTGRVTHLNLVVDERHHYVGWNPDEMRWELILVVEEIDTIVVETASSVFDDETEEPVVWLDPDSDPELEDLVEFVWEYKIGRAHV